MSDRSPRTYGELVPLAERVRRMQLFRVAAAVIGLAFALATRNSLETSARDLSLGIGGYLLVSLISEWLWRRGKDRSLPLFGAMLITDGVFLAWLSYVTGGIVSPLRYLVLLHLIAVSLLASYRTGVKLALWHSILAFVVFYAQEAEILRPFGAAVEGLPGTTFQQLVGFMVVFWMVAFVTGTLSAVNERELRRRRYDLEALAHMAHDLEGADDQQAVAEVLLASVVENFGTPRAVVLGVQGDAFYVMAAHGTERASTALHRPGPHSVMQRAVDARETKLIAKLDPDQDSWLAAVFPDARNLVVLPLSAEGRSVGMLVVEHSLRKGSRIERRVVSTLERFASQAGLALRNASLLEQLQQVAATDGLTGIANRRSFDTILEREVARSARNDAPLTLVMLDIDHFKQLNDTHGHQRGDDVLRRVAAALVQQCREYDTAARYGGEEFAVILPNCTANEAAVAADRLRHAIIGSDSPVPVTASGGVATFPVHGRDAASLVTAADAALYDSKRSGRNRVTVAESVASVASASSSSSEGTGGGS